MKSMVEVLAFHARIQPDTLFAADSCGSEYSYSDAWLEVRRTASILKNRFGIKQGNRIMVECSQDVHFLLVNLACELIQAIFVPIEKNASSDRKKNICEETSGSLWIGLKDNLENAQSITYEEIMSCSSDLEDFDYPEAETIAEVLYTTGTTGTSKGIAISNRANIALAENIVHGVQMKKGNVELIPLPLSHSHALRCFYANLLNGGSVIIADGLLVVKKIFTLMDKYHVTALDLSPSAVALLVKLSKGDFWKYALRLDYIQIGTSSLPEDLKHTLVEKLKEVRLYNFYGSTESGRSCVLNFSLHDNLVNCVGKPTCNSEIVFTDDDGNTISATYDQPGLLASRGPMNMEYYWNNPDLTDSVKKNGFIFTNDLGYIDENGFVYILGRKGDVINCNGIKISPEEIESVAVKFGNVSDACCVPQKDPIAGSIPKLFIVVDDINTFNLQEFVRFLSNNLDGNKVPKKIEFISEVPRTFNGKIQRNKLMNNDN